MLVMRVTYKWTVVISTMSGHFLAQMGLVTYLGHMSIDMNAGIIPQITVGHRLRIAREQAGFDKLQLARITGISASTLTSYELGKTKRFTQSNINLIALVTNVNRDWIMSGDEYTATDLNREPADYRSATTRRCA